MENFLLQFINDNLMIMVAVSYVFGEYLKNSKVKDENIPKYVLVFSIVLCLIKICATREISKLSDILDIIFASITQGTITAGMAVFSNQLIKQNRKKKY